MSALLLYREFARTIFEDARRQAGVFIFSLPHLLGDYSG